MRRRRFDLAVIGGPGRENPAVQFPVVLGFCTLVAVLLVCWFSWEDRG